MLEAAVPAIPSLWASLHGWLTPTVLFLLLNLVIGTIALTSRAARPHPDPSFPEAATAEGGPLSRSLSRLRSITLSSSLFTQIPPAPKTHKIQQPEPEPAPDLEEHHIERSQSDTRPVAGEMPEKLATKMKKSATMKSAFNHFEFEPEAEIAKRPATTKERETREEEAEVDSRADDFINRFKQQLKLQRLDSIVRYKEMLKRGN